jgi:hypothetical protein
VAGVLSLAERTREQQVAQAQRAARAQKPRDSLESDRFPEVGQLVQRMS